MQRFAGLNSIEGWNLTFQLSRFERNVKTPFQDIYIREKLVYNKHVFQKHIPSVGYETILVNSNQRTGCVMYVVTDKYGKGGAK